MNQIINLQIPIKTDLRDQALAGARSLGFTNLQDSIRIFLQQLALNNFDISFQTKPVVLSEKNNRRYSKIIDDIDSGREKTIVTKSTKDMIKYLDDHS
jgi:antitoxin component of RelBE/YafQ-DinJ toxin-antitoxin module